MKSRFAQTLSSVTLYGLVVFLVAGAFISLDYYLEHIRVQHRDMFGVRGAFLMGGTLCLLSCSGGAGVVAAFTKKASNFRMPIGLGGASGLLSAGVFIALNPKLLTILLVSFLAVLALTYVLGRQLNAQDSKMAI